MASCESQARARHGDHPATGRAPPHEPTNHLSLTLAGEPEEAIGVTPGTVIVASHDRWLRRRWDGAVLMLGSNR